MRDFKVSFPSPALPGADELRSLRVPVLALIAGKSIVHDAEKAAARARTLRDSAVEIWPEASHALNGEYPERLAERVHAFLNGLPEHDRQG